MNIYIPTNIDYIEPNKNTLRLEGFSKSSVMELQEGEGRPRRKARRTKGA